MKPISTQKIIRNTISLFFIFLFTVAVVSAQDSYYPDSTIHKKRIPGQGKVYTSNGRVILKGEVDRRLTTFDESAEQYEKSKKRCDRDYYYESNVSVNVNIPVGHYRTGGYSGARGGSAHSEHTTTASHGGGHSSPRGGGGRSHGGLKVPKCSGKGAIVVGVAVLAVGVIIVTPLICEAIIRHDHYKKAIRIYNEKMMNQYG